MEFHPAWPAVSRFPLFLTVAIPVHRLRVRDLIALRPGQIIATAKDAIEDVPLSIGALELAWGEFDVMNDNIALRVTRLA